MTLYNILQIKYNTIGLNYICHLHSICRNPNFEKKKQIWSQISKKYHSTELLELAFSKPSINSGKSEGLYYLQVL